MALTCAGTYQDNFLPGPRQPDVEEPTFFGDPGACGVHWEEPVFHATDEDHRKL
jgi:hypothetical protein